MRRALESAAGVEFDLMLSRSSAVIVSLTSLFAGIVLGVILGRGGPVVSAQVAGAGRGELAHPQTGPRDDNSRRVRRSPTTRLYDVLAKQYEQFQQVNRTFELVAKAVSPSVVHIVAQKTTRAEESRRARQFEETGSGVIIRSDHAPGLFVLTNHHVVDGCRAGQDPRLSARRPVDLAGEDLDRRQGRYRGPQARPRRPAGGAAGQQ